jgi:hypothetical protein
LTTRSGRPSAALAIVLLAGSIGAGCGASAPSGTGTGDNKGATGQAKAVRFAECIRAHGVPHFPDPDAKGEFVFGIDVSPAVWQQAVDACKRLQPPGALSAERSPGQQQASLRFARCIRDHGVEDFPDPADGEPLVDTTRIPSTDAPGGMSVLNAAMDECRDLLADVLGGRR